MVLTIVHFNRNTLYNPYKATWGERSGLLGAGFVFVRGFFVGGF